MRSRGSRSARAKLTPGCILRSLVCIRDSSVPGVYLTTGMALHGTVCGQVDADAALSHGLDRRDLDSCAPCPALAVRTETRPRTRRFQILNSHCQNVPPGSHHGDRKEPKTVTALGCRPRRAGESTQHRCSAMTHPGRGPGLGPNRPSGAQQRSSAAGTPPEGVASNPTPSSKHRTACLFVHFSK